MARIIKRYYQAWELYQQGKTFKDIGKIMRITGSRAAVLSNFIDFKIKYQKQRRISNELKELIKKCRPPPTKLEKKASPERLARGEHFGFSQCKPKPAD